MTLSARHPAMSHPKAFCTLALSCPMHLLTSPVQSQPPVGGSASSGNGMPENRGSQETCTAELHGLWVCNSLPALLCDQQSPSRRHLPFPVVVLLKLFVGSVLYLSKSLCSLRGSSFDHWKRDGYTRCT